jgi:hypothetical protein
MACTKNPIIEYINYILTLKAENPSSNIQTLMEDNSFRDLGTDDEYCCPDCGPLYFIGPVFDFDDTGVPNLRNLLKDIDEGASLGCCENYDISSIAGGAIVQDEKSTQKSKICCNDFVGCSLTFFSIMQQHLFSNGIYFTPEPYEGGIHEYSTFNDQSVLCLINTAIESIEDDDVKAEFLNAFYRLNGFVAYCSGDGSVYTGTLNGFRAWW